MLRSASTMALAVCSCLAPFTPLLAAQPQGTSAPNSAPSAGGQAAIMVPAEKCLGDVRVFNARMSRAGYWLGGSDYGYGYPMGFYGYGYSRIIGGNQSIGYDAGYGTARPGYQIRTLIASATILAQTGQEQTCQTVLATANAFYERYADDLNRRGIRKVDQLNWQQWQIAAAQPVTGKDAMFWPDQLLDADVRTPGNEALGSVHDLVMNPKTGMIAYLIIKKGGIFGIDASYIPVPWADFKAAPGAILLVLDTTNSAMNAAPHVDNEQFTKAGQFDQESRKVNAYWNSHLKAMQTEN